MIDYSLLNIQQCAAVELIKCDLRFIYTMIQNRSILKSNYVVSSMPYQGLIIDGAEDWIKTYNNSHTEKIQMPLFSVEEQKYYEQMRSSIKMWGDSYTSTYTTLKRLYQESDKYFSSVCKPIAKKLQLYDIFGADLVDGKYCGNTILCSYFVPDYSYDDLDGEAIKRHAVIGGKYISLFGAEQAYTVKDLMTFSTKDYGGLFKSPVGNEFSDSFVFSFVPSEFYSKVH